MSQVPDTRPTMIHVGRRVPKDLYNRGWRETGRGQHLGRGVWVLRLTKVSDGPGGPVAPGEAGASPAPRQEPHR